MKYPITCYTHDKKVQIILKSKIKLNGAGDKMKIADNNNLFNKIAFQSISIIIRIGTQFYFNILHLEVY